MGLSGAERQAAYWSRLRAEAAKVPGLEQQVADLEAEVERLERSQCMHPEAVVDERGLCHACGTRT